MIYDDYIQYCNEYSSLYGEKTVVLIQVGDFFELYGVQNETENVGADMYTIGDICNLIVTRKNKSITENNRQNPLMSGFPLYALSKHSQSLLDHGYTVVVIRQVTPPPNVTRAVTEILSPTMNIAPTTHDSNYLVTYYWEPNAVGIAGVDVSTGETFSYEVATKSDTSFIFDEAYRILQSYNPKEVLLTGKVHADTVQYVESMMNVTGSNRTFHRKWGTYKPDAHKLSYQNEVISKVYGTSMLQPFEMIGIERQECARIAFTYMLLFAYEHNEALMQKLHLPTLLHDEQFMTLEYNSAVQLNIIGCFPGDKPLVSILNKCCTSLGSRLFQKRLLSPCINICELTARYERIDNLIRNKQVMMLRKTLKQIGDIERQFRKAELERLSPIEFYSFHNSLEYARNVATYDNNDSVLACVNKVMSSYTTHLLIDECAKHTMNEIKSTLFKPGFHPSIDEIMNTLSHELEYINSLAQTISDLDSGDSCLCRVESNERDGYFLQITKKRWDNVRSKTSDIQGVPLNEFYVKPISNGSNVLRVNHASIETASETIVMSQRKLSSLVQEKYKEFLASFAASNKKNIHAIISYIAETDVATNNAFIAEENGYCKPTLATQESGSSFMNVSGLRHPIIEQLGSKTQYVANDVELCNTGMLLYGINASGKSSLMKAVGIAIVMAQAGMYVAASEMVFSPFHHLFTRITSMDNIYRGMSTFIVEMSELRNILLRADENSMVIGDELCAGTESTSAVAIVAAGIQELLNKRSSFIFATHLHELVGIPPIANHPSLHVYHIHVETDAVTGKIIYDRHLRRGAGSTLYGLEVCKSLGMPTSFVTCAHNVRRHITNQPLDLVKPQWSQYNKHVCVDTCKVCNDREATDVHHIYYQHTASDDGFVKDGVRVHNTCNLVPLCKQCHMEEHHGTLRIHGYRDTSSGSELHFERVEKSSLRSPSFSQVMMALKQKYKYDNSQWYMRTVQGWRKCKENTVIKEAQKSYKYTISEDDLEHLKVKLVAASCS